MLILKSVLGTHFMRLTKIYPEYPTTTEYNTKHPAVNDLALNPYLLSNQ